MTATRIATSREASAATWALSLQAPRSTKRVSSGSAAKIDDNREGIAHRVKDLFVHARSSSSR